MTHKRHNPILFTDLDGTLLDFKSYAYSESLPYLKQLLESGIPVVFCSSKTLPEQLALMAQMDLHLPAIVENGGALYLPHPDKCADPADWAACGQLIRLGPTADEIRSLLQKLEALLGFAFLSYAQIGADGIAGMTGLSTDAASRAANRGFSETLTAPFDPPQQQTLRQQLNKVGLQVECGGRFHTVTGKGIDKGNAVRRMLLGPETRQHFGPRRSIGIGDGPNDTAMLLAVDQAFLVQNHKGQWSNVQLPHLTRIDQPGPRGWVQLAQQLLVFS